jgi:hypothetical protein
MITLPKGTTALASLVGAPRNCARYQQNRPETAFSRCLANSNASRNHFSSAITRLPEHLAGHYIYSIPIDFVPASFKSCCRQYSGVRPSGSTQHLPAGALPINTNDMREITATA